MAATVAGIHLTGTHGARPAGNSAPDGSLYSCTTHGLIYQSNFVGNSWATYAIAVKAGTAAGDILYWDGTNWVILAIGTAGQKLTVAAGLPSWV